MCTCRIPNESPQARFSRIRFPIPIIAHYTVYYFQKIETPSVLIIIIIIIINYDTILQYL